MYQFYYADAKKQSERRNCVMDVREQFAIEAVRPTMWEEHCLECSAPLCFESCLHYQARSDGRCKRFENGLQTFADERACCGQGVHVKFRKWGNMMTVLFPAMMTEMEYAKLHGKNQLLGKGLGLLEGSPLPRSIRWQGIRTLEYLRRRKLRSLQGLDNQPDAFVFHAYSYTDRAYRLIVELYDDHTSVFKLALAVKPGENLFVVPATELSAECGKAGNLVKIYPENDLEAELDILWCDFVKGKAVQKTKPDAKVKCVVWDLDGTLWDGVLIETDDANVLQIRPEVLEVIKALDERGIVQSVASKNDHQAAWPVLERLGVAEYFLYPQIHWNAKSGSLQEIAASLNIGVDSFALIDDSVFEREQVKSVLPQVRVYENVSGLLDLPEFSVQVTEESRNRRAMYKAEEKRNALKKASNTDIVDFLHRCNLRMTIFKPQTEQELLRCYELIVRTNQLNMSGRKYTREEFDALMADGLRESFAFSCADDFGEYGIVGFGQYHVDGGILVFDEFAMSCRVAGKYVESALFAHLLVRSECENGLFSVIKTKKNQLLRSTLEQIGFEKQMENEAGIQYVFTNDLKHADVVSVR
ncbi:MAG: HAD-IIIC family phosphatase [Clostridiales bacterium]|nr:HAD-IIIC family phosphatase [Clostridiales bacterium]